MASSFSIFNYQSTCRLCLSNNGVLSYIKEGPSAAKFLKQIKETLNIDVVLNVDKVCHKCRFKIEMLHDFIKMVEESEKALKLQNIAVFEIPQNVALNNIDNNEMNKQEIESIDSDGNTTFCKYETIENISDVMENTVESNDQEQAYNINNESLSEEDSTYCDYEAIETTSEDIDETIVNSKNEQQQSLQNNNDKIMFPKSKKQKLSNYPTINEASKHNQCLLCLAKISSRDKLHKHIDKHVEGTKLQPYYKVNDRNITCEMCLKVFKYRYNFLTHQREHLNLKPYICEVSNCNMAYSSGTSLLQHSNSHCEKDFVCIHCGARFKRQYELNSHRIIHEDEGLAYICSVCGTICKNRRTYRAHIRKHDKDPRFKCEKCNKGFHSQGELQRHSYRHSDSKQFTCEHCEKAYYSKSALRRHCKAIHGGGKITNECVFCKQTYPDQETLIAHYPNCTAANVSDSVTPQVVKDNNILLEVVVSNAGPSEKDLTNYGR